MISTKPLKKENKFLPKDYIPKRFGLKYDPPTISIIIYKFMIIYL